MNFHSAQNATEERERKKMKMKNEERVLLKKLIYSAAETIT